MQCRRLKKFLVTPEEMTAFLKGNSVAVDRPLPPDATFKMAYWSAEYGCFALVVQSAEYEAIAPNTPIPLSINGPIIAEV